MPSTATDILLSKANHTVVTNFKKKMVCNPIVCPEKEELEILMNDIKNYHKFYNQQNFYLA